MWLSPDFYFGIRFKIPLLAMTIRTLILVPQTKTHISILSLLLSSVLDGGTLSLKGEK